jgi:3-oxoacyl-[acyl-carrier protein] reductase
MARRPEAVEAAIDSLERPTDQPHEGIVADFSDWSATAQAAESQQPEGGWTILVHNAGGPPPGPLVDADPSDLLDAMQPHLFLGQALVQLVRPAMRDAGFGRIVNIVSTSIVMPIKGLGVSNTVRGAIGNWSRTLAAELGPEGITVNNVLPGFTQTARLEALLSKRAAASGQTPEAIAKGILANIPTRRFASPHETAALVSFLCRAEAGSINGTSIPVDGGRLAAQ